MILAQTLIILAFLGFARESLRNDPGVNQVPCAQNAPRNA